MCPGHSHWIQRLLQQCCSTRGALSSSATDQVWLYFVNEAFLPRLILGILRSRVALDWYWASLVLVGHTKSSGTLHSVLVITPPVPVVPPSTPTPSGIRWAGFAFWSHVPAGSRASEGKHGFPPSGYSRLLCHSASCATRLSTESLLPLPSCFQLLATQAVAFFSYVSEGVAKGPQKASDKDDYCNFFWQRRNLNKLPLVALGNKSRRSSMVHSRNTSTQSMSFWTSTVIESAGTPS